ncbi:phage head completion protein [Macrococcus armenti]|uniref:phage head completion protein n=1 Tax=Macrococcus armenti TaxID=2875764 RepID=UPI001CCE6EC7|nr:head-tail adaptor protein [Macrococcus armenti]UBH12425.1 head-tail adaptor protein [Macrococcus armenti]
MDPAELTEKINIVEEKTNNINGKPVKEKNVLYELYAKFITAWGKDYQTAVGTNTQNHIKMKCRQVPTEIDTNKFTIEHNDKVYKIIEVYPDYQERSYMIIVAKRIGS